MSKSRSACHAEHSALLRKAVEQIMREHGDGRPDKIIVVAITHEPEFDVQIAGEYNTTDLLTAADHILDLTTEHEPDGCENCDSAAEAAAHAVVELRNAFNSAKRRRAN